MVLDSSSLISLARAGLLSLLQKLPVQPVIVDVVEAEVVDDGLARGHPDAAAIEGAIGALPRRSTPSGLASADAAVLEAARGVGTLVANDLALGRRARNLGVRWLRTADLVVLLAATGAMREDDARDAITSLADAGRLSPDLAGAYLEDLRP